MIRGIRWTILGISLLWQWPMPLSAQLPPRGITPTPRHTPSPTSTPVPQPTIPGVTSPVPVTPTPTGIYTKWRLTAEYWDEESQRWVTDTVKHEQGADRKTVTVTLWRYKQ